MSLEWPRCRRAMLAISVSDETIGLSPPHPETDPVFGRRRHEGRILGRHDRAFDRLVEGDELVVVVRFVEPGDRRLDDGRLRRGLLEDVVPGAVVLQVLVELGFVNSWRKD